MEGRSSDLNQYKCKKSIRLSIHYLIAIQNLNFVNMAMTPILEPIKLVVGSHSYILYIKAALYVLAKYQNI